jgi:hypothetical protein
MGNSLTLAALLSGSIGCAMRILHSRLMRGEPRIAQRIPAASPTEICWRNNDQTTSLEAETIDVSIAGASISCTRPIERDSIVYLRFSPPGVVAVGRVRHCIQRGLQFVVGLEFTSPLMCYRSLGAPRRPTLRLPSSHVERPSTN